MRETDVGPAEFGLGPSLYDQPVRKPRWKALLGRELRGCFGLLQGEWRLAAELMDPRRRQHRIGEAERVRRRDGMRRPQGLRGPGEGLIRISQEPQAQRSEAEAG